VFSVFCFRMSAFKLFQRVLVYSQGQSAWVLATVNAIHCDGSCDVQYDVTQQMKQVPLAMQASWMNAVCAGVSPPAPELPANLDGEGADSASAPAPRDVQAELKESGEEKDNLAGNAVSDNTEAPPLPPPAAPPPSSSYKMFQQVLVYSQGHSAWVAAIVKDIRDDGSCVVQYEATQQLKQIPLTMQASLMKTVASPMQTSAQKAHDVESDREPLRGVQPIAQKEVDYSASEAVPDDREWFPPPPPPPQFTPEAPCSEGSLAASAAGHIGSYFKVSQKVLVYSKGHSSWMLASINAIHRDGSCDVQYEHTGEMKQIPLAIQSSCMKAFATEIHAAPPQQSSAIAYGKPHFMRSAEGGS